MQYASLLIILILAPLSLSAHPGNTASDGMHFCRTNCDYWGVPWGERHGHGSGSTYTAPPTYESSYKTNSDCPSNSYAYLGTCYSLPNNAQKSAFSGFTCTVGYEEVGYGTSKQCLPKVENGYRIGSTVHCDFGYELYGNSCVKKSSSNNYGSAFPDYNTSSITSCPKNASPSQLYSTMCTCNVGYETNTNKDGCKKISKNQNNRSCRAIFGRNSMWSGQYDKANGTATCTCKKGFIWNNRGTSCVRE